MTGTPIQVPGNPNAVIQPVDMGLPPTPTARVSVSMPSEDSMDNDYGSDVQLRPFSQVGVREDTSFCMDEASIQGERKLSEC